MMTRYFLIWLFISSNVPTLFSQTSAVVQAMDTEIEVKSASQVIYRLKKTVTVLNKTGDDQAVIYIGHNRDRRIQSVKGEIYDAFGRSVRKVSKRDFQDISVADHGSLFEDARALVFKPGALSYPYTVTYEYEVRSKQTLYFPEWYPMSTFGVAVQQATLRLTCPSDFPIRYKEVNFSGERQFHEDTRSYTYEWNIQNLKALREEPFAPVIDDRLPSIKLAPVRFTYQDITGDFSDWQAYGDWMNQHLLKGRDILPQQTSAYIRTMVDSIPDPKEKAKKIYEYVQQKTRYVSVQIGIGGYQPFAARDVDQTGYGDCKALVNYTQALLKVVHIPSYYTLVQAGNMKQDPWMDFASVNQFNHAILCIPFEQDTVWLDCTSKDNPFGYLGTFTDDRLVLACTPQGGKLLRTPKLKGGDSRQNRMATFALDRTGALRGNMETIFTGSQYDNRYFLIHEPTTKQHQRIREVYHIDNMAIDSFQLTQKKDAMPMTTERVKFQARDYGSVHQDRMFVPLNKINTGLNPKESSDRQSDLFINRGFLDDDSVVFKIPPGFDFESIPASVTLEQPFGSFCMDVSTDGDRLVYTRTLRLKQGVYPAAEYQAFAGFFQRVAECDAAKFVLKRTTK